MVIYPSGTNGKLLVAKVALAVDVAVTINETALQLDNTLLLIGSGSCALDNGLGVTPVPI